MNKYIAILMLIASVANGQNRIWSNGSYGKVDPREYLPESLYTNCVAWYCMNQNPAQFATWGVPDGAKNGTSGTQTNANSRPSANSNALSFDGIDDRVTVAHSTSFPTGNVYTISAWVKPTGYGTLASGTRYSRVFRKTTYIDLIYQSREDNTLTNTLINTFSIASGPPLNAWTLITAVASNTSYFIYTNGVLAGSGTATAPVASTADASIGNYDTTGTISRYVNGLIDDLIIIKAYLSASDVLNYLYLPQKPYHL
jgi:hypothetical protein